MILPSLTVATTFFTLALSASSPSRLQRKDSVSAALTGALLLNGAVAYQICLIAQGTFAAAAALGGNKKFNGTCTAPTPTPLYSTFTSSILVTGCPNYVKSSNPLAVGGNSCSPQQLSSNGHLLTTSGWNFGIASSNGACTGVRTPFMLTVTPPDAPGDAVFVTNTFNVDCKTGIMTLSDPTLHLCIASDDSAFKLLYSTTDPSCSTTYTLYLQTVLGSGIY